MAKIIVGLEEDDWIAILRLLRAAARLDEVDGSPPKAYGQSVIRLTIAIEKGCHDSLRKKANDSGGVETP